jgi:hypothetical protein
MSDEVTTHQIKGFCDGVMMKGDWQEYHVNIGKTYPVKLSTKQDDVKAIASAAGTQEAVWTYRERQGGPNPHRPGEFFKNRYLSKVEVGGVLDPALAGQTGGSNAPSGGGISAGSMPSSEGRERSIERQVLVKEVLPHLATFKDQDEMFALLDRLDEWMGRERPTKAVGDEVALGQQAPSDAPVDPDSDIPF